MSDIKRFGAGEGVGFYWTKASDFSGNRCDLVAIDEIGNVTLTTAKREYDDAAPTKGEAVLEHLGRAIKEADSHLDRRRKRVAANPPPPKPEPMDPATAKFHGHWDLD